MEDLEPFLSLREAMAALGAALMLLLAGVVAVIVIVRAWDREGI